MSLIMEQHISADNQQATFCELSWLGGIVDGEGCITVVKGNRGISANPIITIANTEDSIIDKVIGILNRHHIAHYETAYVPTKAKNQTKKQKFVRICGFKRVARFLALIRPHLVGKVFQADWVANFCSSRLERGSGAPYSEHEMTLCQVVWDYLGHGTHW